MNKLLFLILIVSGLSTAGFWSQVTIPLGIAIQAIPGIWTLDDGTQCSDVDAVKFEFSNEVVLSAGMTRLVYGRNTSYKVSGEIYDLSWDEYTSEGLRGRRRIVAFMEEEKMHAKKVYLNEKLQANQSKNLTDIFRFKKCLP